jgi:beta-D-galactosyl-(1->4)-L-rhamnose phosphorylase
VSFISFNDILENGIPSDIDVIINTGREGSSWSGGEHWEDTKIIEIITEWVADGGGFIGIAEPSAFRHPGRFFQLFHLLGTDRETGSTQGIVKLPVKAFGNHFILKDTNGEIDFGNDINNIFVTGTSTEVIAEKEGSPRITVNTFGKGKAVYFSGFRFTPENSRLLHRALFTAAGKESEYGAWTCGNVRTDCAYFPEIKTLAVTSISGYEETTDVPDNIGNIIKVNLEPYGMRIIDLK